MVFTLEALQARHGDSLLLHWGTAGSEKLIVIDGGPSTVYRKTLKPRLQALKAARSPDGRLPIRLLMVSHIDDDHINGVLALARELDDLRRNGQDRPWEIDTLWHNSFDDIIGGTGPANVLAARLAPAARAAAKGRALPASIPMQRHSAVLVASVPQGRDLRDLAKTLDLNVNTGTGLSGGLVTAAKKSKRVVRIDAQLSFTVLGPRQDRIDALQTEWDKQINKMGVARTAAFTDDSIFNLASIVVLAKVGKRRMLLTGDARGDDILAGLTTAKLLVNGMFHVELFKLPHHGSDRNVSTDFFRKVTADHYVGSGDGRDGNPEIATLRMISEARGADRFTLHLTNKEPRLVSFFTQEKARGKKYTVVFRKPQDYSIKIDLADPLAG